MRDSSVSFGTAYTLKAKPSRALFVWWYALHAVLALTVIALSLALYVSGPLLLAVVVHGYVQVPTSGVLLMRSGADRWSLPERRLFDLRLAPGTSFSTLWVRLVFAGEDAPRPVLLLKDQLTDEEWRQLQVAVREQ